jgi:hypothetical protein
MANCHEIFKNYNKQIRLTDDKRNELTIFRDNLRSRILDGYNLTLRYLSIPQKLEFQSQGSFVMDTIIKPIHDDYDIDDGVYFIGSLDREQRPIPEEFHKIIVKAIDRGHEDVEKIEDKSTCVRVKYKKGFHIDIPIYYADNYEIPDLADKEQGWIISNPIEFISWFEDKINSGFQKAYLYESGKFDAFQKWTIDIRKNDVQLRRIVRYLKSWGDLRREEMPCGLIMTILAANNYYVHERDDIALKETLVNIQAKLHKSFICERPTTPKGEDLLKNYKNKSQFLNYLDGFVENAKLGLSESVIQKACEYWQKSLGSRFDFKNGEINQGSGIQNIGLAAGAYSSRPWSI